MIADHKQIKTALIVNVHKATISREIQHKCAGGRGYSPKKAHRRLNDIIIGLSGALVSAFGTTSRILSVRKGIQSESPGGSQKNKTFLSAISGFTTLSTPINAQAATCTVISIASCQKTRRKRYGSDSLRGIIHNQVSSDIRPGIANTNGRLGR